MRLLDLFCGAGGAAMGYHRAGFREIVGVDVKPQTHYPFTFVQGDALWYIKEHGHEFDAIHASPPCQAYSITSHIGNARNRHPNLVPLTREALERSGRPWVMENVIGAPMSNAVVLCGLMFGLRVLRHRLFEGSLVLMQPCHPKHPSGNLTGSSRKYSTGANGFVCVAGHNFSRIAGAVAMGIDWMMPRHELAQAIPPAYTEFIGKQLINAVRWNNSEAFAEAVMK